MIVPMKKVSLIIRGDKKNEALKSLRKLGIVHIEIAEGSGERLTSLAEQIALLEGAIFTIGKKKDTTQKDIAPDEALSVATKVVSLDDEKKQCQAELIAINSELDRLKNWGDIDPGVIRDLVLKGFEVSFYEMPRTEYELLDDTIKTVRLDATKSSVKFMLLKCNSDNEKNLSLPDVYRLTLPQISTEQMRQKISELNARIGDINAQIDSFACYIESIKKAIKTATKEIEFETYATGMADENLSSESRQTVTVAYFKGYIEAEKLDQLKQAASSNSWGLLVEDPSEEDNVPTKLKNNKFVSLIYPLTDFFGYGSRLL